MMINQLIKEKPKEGFGLIVLLTLVLFLFAPIGMFISFSKLNNLKLSTRPFVYVGKFSLGSVIGWGMLVFLFGLMMGLAYFNMESYSIEDRYLFYGVCIPMAITGFVMAIYGGGYLNYTTVIDKFLEELISGKQEFDKDKLSILTAPNVTTIYNAQKFKRMLIDLRNHQIIGFVETEKEYIVQLSESAETMLGVPKVKFSWQCPRCGATNTNAKACEYCDTARTK